MTLLLFSVSNLSDMSNSFLPITCTYRTQVMETGKQVIQVIQVCVWPAGEITETFLSSLRFLLILLRGAVTGILSVYTVTGWSTLRKHTFSVLFVIKNYIN